MCVCVCVCVCVCHRCEKKDSELVSAQARLREAEALLNSREAALNTAVSERKALQISVTDLQLQLQEVHVHTHPNNHHLSDSCRHLSQAQLSSILCRHKSFKMYKTCAKIPVRGRLCVRASPRLLPEITIYGAYHA